MLKNSVFSATIFFTHPTNICKSTSYKTQNPTHPTTQYGRIGGILQKDTNKKRELISQLPFSLCKSRRLLHYWNNANV